jgi:hypothetical protein
MKLPAVGLRLDGLVQGVGLRANISQHPAALRQPLPAQLIQPGRTLARHTRNPAHARSVRVYRHHLAPDSPLPDYR